MTAPANDLVLVTGGSGFVASHCIVQLLSARYRVRTTVRSLKSEEDVRQMVQHAGVSNHYNLSFVAAELTTDAGWADAVKDCTYVLHVASPFPATKPKNEDDLIIPARDGTLRVLRAARDAGVKRVVLTSSFAAVGYGHGAPKTMFTEDDWTDATNPKVAPYPKSKTIAERAAWDFITKQGGSMQLAVVNPTGISGPILSKRCGTSAELTLRLLSGAVPILPDVAYGMVDVRDVADMHLKAMVNPQAAGERFLCTSPPFISVLEMSLVMREGLGRVARKCPTRVAPDWLIRFGALFSMELAYVAPELGKRKGCDISKAKRVLGWEPRSSQEAMLATGRSLVEFGLIKGG